jgi:hypothetical protein
MSMFVFLPKGGLDEFLKKFTLKDCEACVQRMSSLKGTVELPRLKLDNDHDLTGVLPAMGMPLAFTTRADFSGMSDEPLCISIVDQKNVRRRERTRNRGGGSDRYWRPCDGRAPGAAAISFRGGPAILQGHPGEANRAYPVSWRNL